MVSEREAVENAVRELVREVEGWPHVTVGEHRFGGTEFRVGPREIGHVHEWGMLDIAYLRKLRDRLVEEGHTGPHHLLTDSGWTTYVIEPDEGLDHARWLLRLSYLYHVNVLKRTPGGAETFADVDVAAELDGMDLGGPVREAFERR